MKHLTKQLCADMHYIPANNVFAFYLTEGDKAEDVYETAAEEMRVRSMSDGYCTACTDALVKWYRTSCAIVLKQMKAGGKPDQNYPRIELPQWCGALL